MAEEKPPVENAVESAGAPAVAPVVETALGPEIKTETPAEIKTVEATVEEKPVEVKAETKPVETKTEIKPVETKPAETKAEVKTEAPKEEVKVEQKPSEVKTELPKFEALTLPEGVKLEDTQIKEIDSMLGNFELVSKAPHAEVQKFRQAMVDYGLGVVKDAIAKTQEQVNTYWDNKIKEYRESFDKDPEIGGPKKAATTEAARQFIAQHAGSPERAAEIRQLLYDHKLADHPSIIRLLADANLERGEGRPLTAQKAVPLKSNKPWDKMYGNMS